MLIIDRFEGDKAIVEGDEGMFELPAWALPPGAKEGDVLRVIIDEDATQSRRERIRRLEAALFGESE